jgi:hypothetical protein
MNSTQKNTATSNPIMPIVIPSRGGFFSQSVLEHQSHRKPEDMGSGLVTVVFVNSVSDTRDPDKVREMIQPMLERCKANFVNLQAGQKSVAETIVDYAHSINASFIKTASLPDLNGESRDSPTVLEMYEHIRSCRVLTINVTPPEVART